MSDLLLALVGTRRCIRVVNDDISRTMDLLDRETIIVTGDAPGVDAHVKRECKRLGFRLISCHARWNTHGRAAGPERNLVIVRLANRAIAWPAASRDTPEDRTQSAGTWNCVELFEGRSKPVEIRSVAWTT